MASTLFNMTFDPDPSLVLLNHNTLECTRAQFFLILQLMTAAKQTVTRAWKPTSLCAIETKHKVTQAMIHNKIKATIQDKKFKHLKIWQPWVGHFISPGFDDSLLVP